ncbi:MAG: hypothetical protein R3326_04325 [Gemmatimonadota bacterium]|nr:hypothetical protein [Gemmatimonadota bacterium]
MSGRVEPKAALGRGSVAAWGLGIVLVAVQAAFHLRDRWLVHVGA